MRIQVVSVYRYWLWRPCYFDWTPASFSVLAHENRRSRNCHCSSNSCIDCHDFCSAVSTAIDCTSANGSVLVVVTTAHLEIFLSLQASWCHHNCKHKSHFYHFNGNAVMVKRDQSTCGELLAIWSQRDMLFKPSVVA